MAMCRVANLRPLLRTLLFSLIAVALCGCTGPRYFRAYAGPARPSNQVAVLRTAILSSRTAFPLVYVKTIDGMTVNDLDNRSPFRLSLCDIELLPGVHRASVNCIFWHGGFLTDPEVSDHDIVIDFQARAGQVYWLMSSFYTSDKGAAARIYKDSSGRQRRIGTWRAWIEEAKEPATGSKQP